MRLPVVLLLLFTCLATLFAVTAFAQDVLPVRKVVLYKNGMGYFEHVGTVGETQAVEIALPGSQLNDVLKSLTVIDPNGGRIGGVRYDSAAPVDRRLADIPVGLDSSEGLVDFLNRIRGAEVEIRGTAAPVSGRLMSAEIRRRQVGEYTVRETPEVTLFTSLGELRTVELTPAVSLRVAQKQLAGEVSRFLETLDSSPQRDVRRLKIDVPGGTKRRLQVSYSSEAPIWKTTYRLVLDGTRKPLLQAWAIVDNTTPADWLDVDLSLVAGAPISFIQNLSQPLYGRRPSVGLPAGVQVSPQLHETTLDPGTGQTGLAGTVADQADAVIPNATVAAFDERGNLRRQRPTQLGATGSRWHRASIASR